MQIGDIVNGKVSAIYKTHFIVDLPNGWKGLVHVSKISDYFVPKINTMFKVGEKYDFEVIEIDPDNKVKLSWKSIMPRFQKDPFDYAIAETNNGFENLKEHIRKEEENA